MGSAAGFRNQRARKQEFPRQAPAHEAEQPGHPVLRLQRTVGNQAVQRMMRAQEGAFVQRKLAVNEPGDAFEQEADRVSEQVMRTAEPGASPAAESNEARGQGHARVQLKAEAAGGAVDTREAPPIVDEVLRSPGQPLDAGTRAFMEPRFGHDFSGVRVHSDAKAAESASAVQARAYTAGRNVVFGAGEFAPGTHEGQKLLGHELAHVVQQSSPAAAAPQVQRKATAQDEADKKVAVKDHEAQQKNVAALLDDARKFQPTSYNSATDAQVLFHNSVQLLDSGKFDLFILTPTHYSTASKPVFFDQTFKYTQGKPEGGDYPADRDASTTKIDHPSPGESGSVPKSPQLAPLVPMSQSHPKGTPPPQTTPPAPATVTWTSAFMKLYLPRTPVTKDELRDTFIHEAQHVADWAHLRPATLSDWKSMFEEYKAEFRAYWVQPGFTLVDPDPLRTQGTVTVPGSRACTSCPPPATTSPGMPPPIRQQSTNLKNKKQDQIFWKLINEYQHEEFDCLYVCNQGFRDAVDNFAFPVAENLVNSVRLVNLHIELQKLTPAITGAALLKTGFPQAMKDLDRIDWEFLSNEKLSAPLWDLFTTFAPTVLLKPFQKLAKKGAPSTNDIDKVIALVK